MVNADGLGVRRLIKSYGASDARWSPDGKQIVYREGNRGLATINVAGEQSPETATRHRLGRRPDWSPDGTIVFTGNFSPSGDTQPIYVMRVDEAGLRKVTPTAQRKVGQGRQVVTRR